MNKLVKYSLGHGAGIDINTDGGILVIGDSSPSTSSTSMYGVASDPSGNLYISDSAQSCIYKVQNDNGATISVFAGLPGAEGSNDGTLTTARFSALKGIACDRSGVLYVCDGTKIRCIIDNNVGTVATGLTAPKAVAVGPNGNVYVTDNYAVKKIQRASGSISGEVTVIAGKAGVSGDISAEYCQSARFGTLTGITVLPNGDIVVMDAGNQKLKLVRGDGFVVRYSGSGSTGNVYGAWNVAQFTNVTSLASDKSGNVYLADAVSTWTNYVKLVNLNGASAEVSKVHGGNILGVAVTPSGVVYLTRSYAGGTNTSSSSSSSSTAKKTTSSLSSHH